MPGKRSPEANLRRKQNRRAHQIINSRAVRDRELGEVVNTVAGRVVVNLLSLEFSDLVAINTPSVELGEVLADSRGRGTQQQILVESRNRAIT